MDRIASCVAETRPASPVPKQRADQREFEGNGWLATAAVSVLAVAAVLLGWRRAAGVLIHPPSPLLLGATGLVLAAVAAVGHRSVAAWRRKSDADSRHWGFETTSTIAVAVAGLAITFPSSGIGPLAIFWAVLLGGELWGWRRSLRKHPFFGLPSGAPDRPTTPKTVSAEPAARPLPEAPAGDDIVQQTVRGRTPEGHDRLSGWVCVRFDAGQRTANAHLAFCPPFAVMPEMRVEQIDGPFARVKIGQILSHGARFDLKLDRVAAEPSEIHLGFSAQAPAEDGASVPRQPKAT